MALLLSWIRTPDWSTSRTYLQAHCELLTQDVARVLATLTQHQPDQQVRELLIVHQQLLQIAGQMGVEAAYQSLLHQEEKNDSVATAQEDLQAQIIAWLQTSDRETSQAYLQSHPRLLTDAAEQMMEVLKQSQREPVQAMIHLRQALLQKARIEGIEAAYRRVLDPEPETSLDDQEVATSQTPQDPATLDDAGIAALHQYWVSGQLVDLDRAVLYWHKALTLTPHNSPGRPGMLNNLGLGLSNRYDRSGDLADLDAAITAYQEALQATPPDSPDWTGMLSNLGTGLSNRYDRSGNLADLDAAITAYRQAVQATPPDLPARPMRLSNLGAVLSNLYARSGSLADLDTAISAHQQAIQATPSDSPDRPERLNNLGAVLRSRYKRKGGVADLDAAITAYQQAIQATPSDSPNQAGILSNLGLGLVDHYTCSGNLADLEAAINAHRQAVQATPLDSSDRPGYLSNLGTGLRNLYARSGNLTDLEAAISAHQQAVQATSPDSPNRPARLSNLGTGLRNRYARSGDLTDLEAAITAFQQAVQATLPDSPNRPGYLSNLGTGLRDRYARSGDLTDLNAAITAFLQSVDSLDSLPPDASDRPILLSNLGSGLIDRYTRTGELANLEAAIAAFLKAVNSLPPDAPDRPPFLSNLGNALSDHYTRSGDLTDLDAAISVHQQAVQATSPDSPNWPALLNNLGNALRTRYPRSEDLADLNAAVAVFQQAVQATPPGSSNLPRYLSNLGTGLRTRYTRTGIVADLESAITSWETSWSILYLHFAALPVIYQLGQQLQEGNISGNLVTAYLEHAALRRPGAHADQRSALVIAEGNKSRLLTRLVGRGPLPPPAGLSPRIAEQERQLLVNLTALDTQELANYGHSATAQEENSRLSRLQQRQVNVNKLEDLWTHIARLGPQGMEYVALRRGNAQTWQDLTQLAKKSGAETALLSFFTTADQALLLLLRAGWRMPRVVEIPLNQAGWDDLLERFFREVHRYGPGLRRSETWDQTLRPLFTRTQHHLEGVERLILAPAGNGHLLPWGVLAERAGWHTPTGQPLPLVTLPALGILPRLRQRPHVHTASTLVVGNPRDDLPHAEIEANQVAERFGTNPLLGTAATKAEVLARFPDATLIHLATHAAFHTNDPLESGIVLADGVLTAREVLQHRLQADLLVLSACESGQVGSLGGEELAGLSQAFLQTGVRSLIVSLWRVDDPATAAFIQAFYSAWQAGADKALALRQAMTRIQHNPHWSHPYYWGAFVLLGDWD
jgi:CHAT domain-containing protein